MKIFSTVSEKVWEYDYIKYDLLAKVKDPEYIEFNVDTNDAEKFTSIVIIGYSASFPYPPNFFERFEKLLKKLRPVSLFFLSDEECWRPDILSLSQWTNVMFRQYNCPNYQRYPNVVQIPLGYMVGMLSQKSSLDIVTKFKRKYTWSSILSMKRDRQEMIDKFKNSFGDDYYLDTSGKVSPEIMRTIYEDSIFVPCGWGNANIDCFRLYEACLLGAIPVLAGDYGAFYFNGDKPPFVYGNGWDDAIVQCKKLLENPKEVVKKQKSNLEWWKRQILMIQDKVQSSFYC
jgi:hypothetical protein